MTQLVVELIGALLLILLASELFTNALEHAGEKLQISDGVTGSLFAAVATALPETMVPILALFAGTSNVQVNEEIGVGAILGAPLMLSTLSICLMGVFVLKHRGLLGRAHPEYTGLRRDLNTFLVAFGIATIAMFVPPSLHSVRAMLSFALVLIYFLYILRTIHVSKQLVKEGHGTAADNPLWLSKIGLRSAWPLILVQLLLGLVLLVLGAEGFIHGIEGASQRIGVSALLLSLLIVPIATELPEKINSILWIRRGKDTLAFGNITGAMVFQGTLLPAIGIMLTPWSPRREVLVGILIALIAVIWLRCHVKSHGFPLWVLLINGALYVSYLLLTLIR